MARKVSLPDSKRFFEIRFESPDVIVALHGGLLAHPATLAGMRADGTLIYSGYEGEEPEGDLSALTSNPLWGYRTAPLGGVLPLPGNTEFQLPKEVLDWEIDQLKRLGVEIVCNVIIGNRPNPLLLQTTMGLKSNKWGCLVVEDESAQTSLRHVFAGGDAVTGAATVILAAGAGKSAATAIHEDLCG